MEWCAWQAEEGKRRYPHPQRHMISKFWMYNSKREMHKRLFMRFFYQRSIEPLSLYFCCFYSGRLSLSVLCLAWAEDIYPEKG